MKFSRKSECQEAFVLRSCLDVCGPIINNSVNLNNEKRHLKENNCWFYRIFQNIPSKILFYEFTSIHLFAGVYKFTILQIIRTFLKKRTCLSLLNILINWTFLKRFCSKHWQQKICIKIVKWSSLVKKFLGNGKKQTTWQFQLLKHDWNLLALLVINAN